MRSSKSLAVSLLFATALFSCTQTERTRPTYRAPYEQTMLGEPYKFGIEGYFAQADIVVLGRAIAVGGVVSRVMPGDGGHVSDIIPVTVQIDEVLADNRLLSVKAMQNASTVTWLVRGSQKSADSAAPSIEVVIGDQCVFFLREAGLPNSGFIAHRDAMGRVSSATQDVGVHELFGRMSWSEILEQIRATAAKTKTAPLDAKKVAVCEKDRGDLQLGQVYPCDGALSVSAICGKDSSGYDFVLFAAPSKGSYDAEEQVSVGNTTTYRFRWNEDGSEEGPFVGFLLPRGVGSQQENSFLRMTW